MYYAILGEDNENSLELRHKARPAHIARVQALHKQGRVLVAGPLPAIDSEDPGPAGFTGSLLIIEFDSLESIIQAVNDGLGISILPADIANSRKELKTVQYQELSEKIRIDFVIKHRKQQPQSLKKFIRFLQSL
jgi:uncharacterized protein YciI